MMMSRNRFAMAMLAGVATLALLGSTAQAQRMPFGAFPSLFTPGYGINQNPYINPFGTMTLGQGAYNTAVMGQAMSNLPYGGMGMGMMGGMMGGFGSSAMGAYGGLYSPYMFAFNPYQGYLSGAADITNANGKYQINIQKARMKRYEANMKGLEYRRKMNDELRYERMNTPTPEDLRQKDQQQALERARHNAPETDVLSGTALNNLLNQAQKDQGTGNAGPNVPLSEDALKGINVAPRDARGNVGLLKNNGRLDWPLPLLSDEFRDPRDKLSRAMGRAVRDLKNNPNLQVEPGLIKDMQDDLKHMQETLDSPAVMHDMSFTQHMDAQRYLNQVADAVRALQSPSVGNHFNGNWAPKGKNVAELIKYMADNGLSFQPATPGDSSAYWTLYRALLDFDAGMQTAKK